jgi:glycosyltransferase involved in cell wall biosynthesis
MQLSLVICTRNRASQLAESLRSLTKLQYPDLWELVIVDNGSKDETQEVIKSFGKSLLVKSVIEPRAGLGRAHNRALAIARGDIIAFTDDDCYPAPDFLSSIARCFEEDPRLGFIGGRVLLYDPSDYRSTIQEKDSRQNLAPGEFFPTGLIHGANFACRRKALEVINGFDDRFGPGTPFVCEEVDAMARMLACGWPGAYDPRPLVYHHHGRKTRAQAVQLKRRYDKGRGAYYAKSILNPKLRAVCLQSWRRTLKGKTFGALLRELSGATEFIAGATLSKVIPGLRGRPLTTKGQGQNPALDINLKEGNPTQAPINEG